VGASWSSPATSTLAARALDVAQELQELVARFQVEEPAAPGRRQRTPRLEPALAY